MHTPVDSTAPAKASGDTIRNAAITTGVPAMQIPVLIEPIDGNGFRARGGGPLELTVEAPTRQQALAKLKEELQARLRNGAEIVSLELASDPHPLAEFVGMFKDDPMIEDWKEAMADYRRKIDEKPELP
jgi:hypothetical protein